MDQNTAEIFGSDNDPNGFDIINYFKRPYVITRTLGWLFSIIVFGCISTSSRHNKCPYIDNGACSFGIAIGVLAFLYLTALFFAEVFIWKYLDQIKKKYLLIFDAVLTGVWSFMWFIGFCFMVDTWRKQDHKEDYSVSDAQAAIAFSFFSIFVFVALCIMAVQRFRKVLESDDEMLTDGGDFDGRIDPFNESTSYQQADLYPTPFNEDLKNPNLTNATAQTGYQQQS